MVVSIDMFDRPTILCFSIIVTNRCNANCTYCHFYGLEKDINSKGVKLDISDQVYFIYLKFLRTIKEHFKNNNNVILQFRFSGGDPIMLGNRLFELVDIGYRQTGIKPYILTNGIGLTSSWIKKARNHNIGKLMVSLENIYSPDPGAPKTKTIVDKINKFNSKELPIIPGVCIVKNSSFARLYEICKYFYDNLGTIPIISELNFQAFEIPSESEYLSLFENIKKIVGDYYNKTQLVLFPYISPELSYSGMEQLLFELDLDNKKYSIQSNDSIDAFIDLISKQREKSYPKIDCMDLDCDWQEFCQRYKWVWTKSFNSSSVRSKFHAYCRLKKIINQAFYEA